MSGPFPDGANVMAGEGDASPRVPRAVVAHRGDSGSFPENTVSALAAAVDLGVECIELDVHLSADDELIIIHDGTVDRTSDGEGAVRDLTLARIKALDAGSWFDVSFAGQRFLTLEEAVALIPAPVRMNVHVKATDETREVVTRRTVDLLLEEHLLDRAYLASDEATLAVARAHCPSLEVCNLSTTPAETYVERCAAIGCRILQPGHGMTDAALVEAAHDHGMLVFPFYADDLEGMQRLLGSGVDGMLTNQPARLLELLTTL